MTFLDVLRDVFGAAREGLFLLLTEVLNIPVPWANGILMFIGGAVIATFVLMNLILTIWFERKLMGRIQDRVGPNRVGPWGIFQTVADLGKLATKEIIIPSGADLIPFMLAPIIMTASVVLVWAVMPFTPTAIGADLNIGALYIVAVGSFGILAVLMAGWSSNNKYALLGAFRAVAMLVSYEVPMILGLMVPVMLAGSMSMQAIVAAQPVSFFFMAPLMGLIFWIAMVAEVGRQPFDLLEAESEIVAGYSTEYGGFAFAMFYAAEWAHGFTICALMAILYFGGWRGPFVEQAPTLGVIYLGLKTGLIYFFQVWSRATLPRLRIDQVMDFCWKGLIPAALVLLVGMALADRIAGLYIPGYTDYLMEPSGLSQMFGALPRTAVLFGVNVLVGLGALLLVMQQGRRERARLESRTRAIIEPGTRQPIPDEVAGQAR